MGTSRVGRIAMAALVVAAAGFVPAENLRASMRHLRLVRSFPSADTVLTRSPDAVRLWWSEAAELPFTKVELVGTTAGKIPLEKATRASAKGSPVVARVPKALPAGTYRVSWRTMSRDGHAIKGEFAFRVSAQAARK
ncbi:MAG TPA: copper resistance CopC family protein [Gemmatimonas sp.]|nr:copper resistance CopC family protein [Gemmatimonas sp.]